MPGSTARDDIGYCLYLPPATHRWLKLRAAATGTSMNKLINRYVLEGRVRDELADAAAETEPAPGGLQAIQRRTARPGPGG